MIGFLEIKKDSTSLSPNPSYAFRSVGQSSDLEGNAASMRFLWKLTPTPQTSLSAANISPTMPCKKETDEVIDLTADLTDADYRKLESIVCFYKTALDKAVPLIDPDSLAEFTRLAPQPPPPSTSLPVKHAYYKSAVNNAGEFLNGTRRYMDQLRRDEGHLETWTKGAPVMLRVSFGRFIKSSAMFFPLWMNPMLSEVGIDLLAHESKGVSRLDPTMMLACLGLDSERVEPPLVYICEPHEFIVTWVSDKDGCEQEPVIDIPDSVWEKARATLDQGRDYRDWARVGRDLAARYQFIKEFGIERAMEFEHAREAGYGVAPGKVRELHGQARLGGGKAFAADGTPLW